MSEMRSFLVKRQRTAQMALMLGFLLTVGSCCAFAAETGSTLPWEGPLTTLVTSLTGPVAYAISVVAIVALGATLAFAGGEMGETMTVLRMQKIEIGPGERNSIHRALQQLASAPRERRTLTELEANLQDERLKAGLQPYVIDGALGGLLDSRNDGLTTARFVVCEMETLLSGSYGEATVMAVLLYLFRRMERALDGSPTLVPIDEAWLFLKHPAWRDKIQDWLKTLRKKNAVVLLATQSMADVKESPIASAILQSTATKIYLPNSEAGNEGMRQFYEYAGLNSREIELLQTATPKRDYYIVQRLGRRMISFRLGPVALAFLGVSGQRDRARIDALAEEYGEGWIAAWMKERKVEQGWIDYFEGVTNHAIQMAI